VVGDSGTVGRALDVLLALGDDEAANNGGLGVVRIAELLGREKSQISRTLKTLAAHGFVDRDPDTLEYRLGWRLYTLAARTGRSRLLALAPAQLRRLVDALGETAHLSVLDGDEVLTLISERSPRLVQASDWSGHRVPAHCTSSGRALLLDADPRSLTRGQYRSVVRARELGYAAVDGEFEPGLVGVAAPVRDFRDRIVAALNVSGPTFRLGERLHAAGLEVRRAADDLSRQLGQSDDNGGNDG
jgi:IclR family transcriptional regulator, KDG regulon repressor